MKLWFNQDKLRIVPDGFACCNVSQGFAVLKDYIDSYKGPNKAKGSIVRWTPHNFFLHLTSGQIWTRWKELRMNLACMGIARLLSKILGLKILAWNFEIFVVWEILIVHMLGAIYEVGDHVWASWEQPRSHGFQNPRFWHIVLIKWSFAVLRLECHFCWTLACHMYGTIVWYILPL